MYLQHWGLHSPPFRSDLDPAGFFPAAIYNEALARMQFLIAEQRRLGLLIGPTGAGKSLLLQVLAAEVRENAGEAVLLSLTGMSAPEFTVELGTQLGTNLSAEANLGQRWRAINDHLAAGRYARRDTVVLLDDADRAEAQVREQIVRLVGCATQSDARLTVILTAGESTFPRLGARLLEITELRIDLEPLDSDETNAYVRAALSRAGRAGTTFAPEARERLFELSGGIPRWINRLAHLALVAAAGSGLAQVDAGTVDAVSNELAIMS